MKNGTPKVPDLKEVNRMLELLDEKPKLRRMYWGAVIALYLFGASALIHSVRWW